MTMVQNAQSTQDGEEVLFEGRPALIPGVGALLLVIVTLGLWLIVCWIRTLRIHYRITSRRIVVEYGVLSKRLEQLDLYRIADYTVERPFGQRLLGTGNLLLKTFDKTTPQLEVRWVKADVLSLYERLRTATEAEKARRNVRMVDYEGSQ